MSAVPAPTDADACHAPAAVRARAGAARVVVAGNPNAGKSTLFNALTGGQAQTGNFPGTTVSSLTGRLRLRDGTHVELVDVPGTYSLSATSPDERVAIDAVLGLGRAPPPDAVVLVVDAPRLMRSLYLVVQVLELGVPVVVAVNLMDEARGEGLDVRLDALAEALGVPVVGTVARSREGLGALVDALGRILAAPVAPGPPVGFGPVLDADVAEVARALPHTLGATDDARGAALARWVLMSADAEGHVPGLAEPVAAVPRVRARAAAAGRDLDAELVATRYAWIDAREAAFLGRPPVRQVTLTERIDRLVLHPVLGTALFAVVMGLAFMALFAWADPLIGLVEAAFEAVGGLVATVFDAVAGVAPAVAGPLRILRDLTVDGLVGGVGSILVFLPQIGLLFLFLAVLEDSGYLARAAHLADRVLRAAGLPGRAFVPLLSGYACAVPAILATRTMPRFRDRLVTMLVLPLTSCSARLPVYTLLIAALFPATVAGFVPLQPLALAGMYLLSTAAAVLASLVVGRTVLPQGAEPALLELPPYRIPDPRVVLGAVVQRCTDFVREAGGIILVATVLLWGLLYFPRHEPAPGTAPEVAAEAQLEQSFAGRLGHAIEPAIAPLGFDWRMGIGILGAFAAREVFVTTMGVVYGVGDGADEGSTALRDRIREDRRADGSPTYTPLVGLSLMVFFALALQCLSTLAVLRKETGGWRWPVAVFAWNGALAWVSSFLVYQGGRLLAGS